MSDQAAAARLKRAIHVARAKANILYDTDLAVTAGVSYDTLMNWYAGNTVPRGAELRRVAKALGLTYSDLMGAYEGVDPEPPSLQDAIKELVDEMRLSRAQQDEATLAVLRALAAVLPPDPTLPGTRDGSEHGAPADTRR